MTGNRDNADDKADENGPPLDPLGFLPGSTEIACIDCGCLLRLAMIENVKVAACDQCGGILLPREVMGTIVNQARAAWDRADIEPTPMNASDLGKHASCPACGQKMETFAYAGPGNIAIDACNECDMTWLNGGEFARIVRAPGNR